MHSFNVNLLQCVFLAILQIIVHTSSEISSHLVHHLFRLLATVGEQISVTRELVTVTEDVGGVSCVGGEAGEDDGLVALLVVEVVGVLRLDEGCAGPGRKPDLKIRPLKIGPP